MVSLASCEYCQGFHLYRLVGQEKIKVNSFHHQAVKKLGSGLKVVAWSNDNIIEALAGKIIKIF